MSSMEFELKGFEELADSLEKVEKRFPASTETVLKRETRITAKSIKENTIRRIKKHGKHDLENKKDKYLQDSFSSGKITKKGNHYTNAAVSSAPHYHLVEEGHDLYSHYKKDEKGKRKLGTAKKIGEVEGKKIVAQVMAKRAEAETAQAMGERLLNEIFKEAGFDD